MRKVILFNMISLDGFFVDPNGGLEWHHVDEEFNDFAIEQLDGSGGLIFGRVTYEMMAEFWPSEYALRTDPDVARRMNAIAKIVASRRLESAGWINTRLVKTDISAEIYRLKQQEGGDLFVFGSANLAATLLRDKVIDEIRLIVNPVVLGGGRPLFEGLERPLELRLKRTRVFGNGNVLLVYDTMTGR